MTAPLPHLLIPVTKFRLKKFLWVICKILGLFVNPFTSDNKFSLLKKSNLLEHFQIQLSQKRKSFSPFFFSGFSKFRFIFEHFDFWIYRLRNTLLNKCLKSLVSEDPSTSDMGNGQKHCWNLKDSTFTIFIDYFEDN